MLNRISHMTKCSMGFIFLINFPVKNSSSQTNKPLVHHMTLFECSTSSYPSSDPISWDIWVKSSGAVCNSNLLTPRDWDACITPVAVWTISSTGKACDVIECLIKSVRILVNNWLNDIYMANVESEEPEMVNTIHSICSNNYNVKCLREHRNKKTKWHQELDEHKSTYDTYALHLIFTLEHFTLQLSEQMLCVDFSSSGSLNPSSATYLSNDRGH